MRDLLNIVSKLYESSVNDKKWYHGSPSSEQIDRYDLSRERLHNKLSPIGMYMTPRLDEAVEYATNYGKSDDGWVYTIKPDVNNPFSNQDTLPVNDELIEFVRNWYKEKTYHNDQWIEDAKIPAFIENPKFDHDMTGDYKVKGYQIAGFDSYLDGEHLVVFDPSDVKIIDAKPVKDFLT